MKIKEIVLLFAVMLLLGGCMMKPGISPAGASGGAASQQGGGAEDVGSPENAGEMAEEIIPDEQMAQENAGGAQDAGDAGYGEGQDAGDAGYGEGQDSGDDYEENPADGDEDWGSDGWSGTFESASGESISISMEQPERLDFTFAVSGISGAAQPDGNQAVYEGEDGYEMLFSLSGDTLTITVSNPEDPGAGELPMNGSYERVS